MNSLLPTLTIRQKGLILTLVPFLFTALFFALVMVRHRDTAERARRSLDQRATDIYSQELFRTITDAELGVSEFATSGDPNAAQPYYAARGSFSGLAAMLDTQLRGDETGVALVRRVYVDASDELAFMGQVVELLRVGARQRAAQLLHEHAAHKSLPRFRRHMDALFRHQQQLDEDRQESLARSWEQVYWLMVASTLVEVAIVCVLSLVFSQGIRRRIETLADNAQVMARGGGELADVGGKDELAQLDLVFRDMAKHLQESGRRERTIIENAIDLICTLNEKAEFTRLSPASRLILGYAPEELVGRPLLSIVVPDDVDRTSEMLRAVQSGAPASEFENRCLNRDREEVTLIWSAYWSGSENQLFCVAHDITERKRAEARIWHQAYHDSLTELPNRLLFVDRLSQSVAHAKRHQLTLAVMFLDLDRFKVINDSLGHYAGDSLLREIAIRLQDAVRKSDTVARMGGDEFTVLLPQLAHSEDAAVVARKISDAIRQPLNINYNEVHVTTSIGIALYPTDGEDAETLLKSADAAQYRVKLQSRDGFGFYHSDMNATALERLKLESNLRRALERGELALHYQPQVSLRTGKIVGMEALIRWQSRSLGSVAPAQFIPLAEETGLITVIGSWVLEEACKQNRRWQDAGYPPMKVAVNLSARQLRQPDLVETVAAILKRTGLDPSMLELEVTETSLMQDMDHGIDVLDQLRALGIQISIDDFGTGYSSLVYLKNLPFDTLKIDQSFVRDVTVDSQSGAIVSTVITLAQSLNRKVIAEGVETEAQLEFLRSRHCDERQGYLFSRPLPPDALTELLSASAAVSP